VIEFIFMLTRDDVTVGNALEVLDELRGSGLRYVGFKDVGPPPAVLTEVTQMAHAAGMEVMLEVVSTSREDELRSLRAAREIGVDWVLGGTHAREGAEILGDVGYCPFAGSVIGHPSVLAGEIGAIAADAARLTATKGVDGVDLLAYRHETVDPVALTRAVVQAATGPVIAAGSVASIEQIAALKAAGAWAFTIGTAIFEGAFGPSIADQVTTVLANL
jgi:NAD(P)H-dependent flavin oxidoreductase YrpB (nitropropane dioxygenase family)